MGVHFILNFSKPYMYQNLRSERKQMITYRGFILTVYSYCIVGAGSLRAASSVSVTARAGLYCLF